MAQSTMSTQKESSSSGQYFFVDPLRLLEHCSSCGKHEPKSCCGKCKIPYCSGVSCQKADWPKHKPFCRSTDQMRQLLRQDEFQQTLIMYAGLVCILSQRICDRTDKKSSAKLDQALANIAKTPYTCCHNKECRVTIHDKPTTDGNPVVGSMEKFPPGTCDIYWSACRNADGLPFLLADLMAYGQFDAKTGKTSTTFSGNDVRRIVWLHRGTTVPPDASIVADATLFRVFAIPEPTLNNPTMQIALISGATMHKLVQRDLDWRQRALYLISFDPRAAATTAATAVTTGQNKTNDEKVKAMDRVAPRVVNSSDGANMAADGLVTATEMLNAAAAKFDKPDMHTFGILVNRIDGILLQSYYGLYTLADWLDFEHDFKRNPVMLEPEEKRYYEYRQIQPKPLYRKLLNPNDLLGIAKDIDALTFIITASDHSLRLTNITGVKYHPSIVTNSYNVNIQRIVF